MSHCIPLTVPFACCRRIELRDYVTAMDVHPRNGMLIAGTVGRTGTEVSRGGLFVLKTREQQSASKQSKASTLDHWQQQGSKMTRGTYTTQDPEQDVAWVRYVPFVIFKTKPHLKFQTAAAFRV